MFIKTILRIDAGGHVLGMFDDSVRDLFQKLGTHEAARRASHVDLNDDGTWRVDLTPVGGGQCGPFGTRDEAIEFEKDCLRTMGLPWPGE